MNIRTLRATRHLTPSIFQAWRALVAAPCAAIAGTSGIFSPHKPYTVRPMPMKIAKEHGPAMSPQTFGSPSPFSANKDDHCDIVSSLAPAHSIRTSVAMNEGTVTSVASVVRVTCSTGVVKGHTTPGGASELSGNHTNSICEFEQTL